MNATFWSALGGSVIALWLWWRCGARIAPEHRAARVMRLLSPSWFLVCLALVNALNAGMAIYMCYVAPGDVTEDIAAAQGVLRGERIYDPHLSDALHASLQNDPARFSLAPYWPALNAKESVARRVPYYTQAHPPLMAVVFAALVALFGIRGTCLGIAMLSLAALGLVLFLLRQVLAPSLPARLALAAVAAVLGWEPVISLLRQGQSGLLLTALMVLGWWRLRQRHAVSAGVAIGAATCLKLYPGLLLVYLFLRNRQAFRAALLTILALLGLPLLVLRWQDYLDFVQTARTVVMPFAQAPHNLSLLGLLTRDLGLKGGSLSFPVTLLSVLGVLLIGATGWLVCQRAGKYSEEGEALDLEYSLFLVLMPLLSPVAWDHYLTILLLPVAVLGRRVVACGPSWATVSGFFALLAALSTPILTLIWLFAAPGRPRNMISSLDSLITWAMIALWLWSMKLYRELYVRGD
ncbi:MAG: glycosyltransferase family 87 protein [Bryobacteraceae bacterium]